MVTVTQRECAAVAARRGAGRYGGIPALALATGVLSMLLWLGTPAWDIARYAGYLLWAVLLPGVLVYRALRARPHSLLDDVTMGAAVGLVLEIVAFVLASVSGLRAGLWAWPLLVLVPFAVVPRLRCHAGRVRYPHRTALAWAGTVAGVALFFVAYLSGAFMRANQPVPVHRPQAYMNDQMYLMSVAADLMHHLPPATPGLGGEVLRYHWFAFAHLAAGSLISGVDLPVIMFRLALPALAVLAVGLLALAGWRVTGRPWVGPVAAALMFMIGELAVPRRPSGSFGSIVIFYGWSSQSVLYGTALALPLLVLISDRLRGTPAPRRAWVLLVGLALALPGAKSTELPIVICGLGLVCLVGLVRRRPARAPWLIGAVLVGSQLVNMAVLYGFARQGLRFGPFAVLIGFVGTAQRPPTLAQWKLVGYGLGAYAICMGTRLAGIPVLARVHRRRWGDVEWLLLGALAGGVAGTLLIWHVSWSQHFFLIAGWPFGAILSAAGLVGLAEHFRLRRGAVVPAVAAAFAVATVVPLVLWPVDVAALPGYGRLPAPYRIPLTTYLLGTGVAAFAVAVACGFGLARGWRRAPRGAGVFAALCVLLAAGLAGMPWDARYDANRNGIFSTRVTPVQAAGARWLRAHSAPDDLIATNVHRVNPLGGSVALSYWIPAFTERRVLLGSWGYSARSIEITADRHLFGVASDFWDPGLLAANDDAIYHSSPEGTAWLRRYGVRWVVVDRDYGAESPALARLARLRWQRGTLAIYEVEPF